jgi:hypothetical protein
LPLAAMTETERECRQSWHEAAMHHHDSLDGLAEWASHQQLAFRCHHPDAHMPPSVRYRPHLGEARRKLGMLP